MKANIEELEQLIKNVQSGVVKTLSKNDTFKFACNICGNCCRNRNDIILSPYDIYRLEKALNLSATEILKKYCSICIGENSGIPLILLKFKKSYNYTVCPFLHNEDNLYKCKIHQYKPTVCALYPLGRIVEGDKRTNNLNLKYIYQPVDCCSENVQEYKVQDWLNDFNLIDSETQFLEYSNFISEITKTIDLDRFKKLHQISDSEKNMFYNLFINIIYTRINTTEDINIQLSDYYKEILDVFSKFVSYANSLNINIQGKKVQ